MKAILERELKVEMHILGANTLILFHWLVMNIYTTVCISYLVKKRKRKIQWQVKRVWFWCESYQSGNHGSAPKMLDQSVTNFTPWWLSSLESSFFMSPRKLEDGICQPSPAWEGEDSKKLLWTPLWSYRQPAKRKTVACFFVRHETSDSPRKKQNLVTGRRESGATRPISVTEAQNLQVRGTPGKASDTGEHGGQPWDGSLLVRPWIGLAVVWQSKCRDE